MTCRIIRDDEGNIERVNAPNGKESKLFKDLTTLVGDPELALREYAKVFTKPFKDWFGDWESSTAPAITPDVETINSVANIFSGAKKSKELILKGAKKLGIEIDRSQKLTAKEQVALGEHLAKGHNTMSDFMTSASKILSGFASKEVSEAAKEFIESPVFERYSEKTGLLLANPDKLLADGTEEEKNKAFFDGLSKLVDEFLNDEEVPEIFKKLVRTAKVLAKYLGKLLNLLDVLIDNKDFTDPQKIIDFIDNYTEKMKDHDNPMIPAVLKHLAGVRKSNAAKLGSQPSSTGPVKKGVNEIFKDNPELAKIGTPEQYSAYLDSIFPGSPVKDVLTLSTTFNLIKDPSKGIKSLIAKYRRLKGFLVSPTNTGHEYGQKSAYKDYKVLINPRDGFIEEGSNGSGNGGYKIAVESRIHVLGSKKDVEGFKAFSETSTGTPSNEGSNMLSKATDLVMRSISNRINKPLAEVYDKNRLQRTNSPIDPNSIASAISMLTGTYVDPASLETLNQTDDQYKIPSKYIKNFGLRPTDFFLAKIIDADISITQGKLGVDKDGKALSRRDTILQNIETAYKNLTDNIAESEYMISDVSDGYLKFAAGVAENGGDFAKAEMIANADDALKQKMVDDVKKVQVSDINTWISYLKSRADYPIEFKHYVLNSVLKHNVNGVDVKAGTVKLGKRTKSTVKSFETLNAAVLAKIHDVPSSNNKFLGDYAIMLNTLAEETIPTENEFKRVPQGVWYKFKEGDSQLLSQFVSDTPWCTASESTARGQLNGGDFYVFRPHNKETHEKIAIRFEEGDIHEMRGTQAGQDLKDSSAAIASDFINAHFPGQKKQILKLDYLKSRKAFKDNPEPFLKGDGKALELVAKSRNNDSYGSDSFMSNNPALDKALKLDVKNLVKKQLPKMKMAVGSEVTIDYERFEVLGEAEISEPVLDINSTRKEFHPIQIKQKVKNLDTGEISDNIKELIILGITREYIDKSSKRGYNKPLDKALSEAEELYGTGQKPVPQGDNEYVYNALGVEYKVMPESKIAYNLKPNEFLNINKGGIVRISPLREIELKKSGFKRRWNKTSYKIEKRIEQSNVKPFTNLAIEWANLTTGEFKVVSGNLIDLIGTSKEELTRLKGKEFHNLTTRTSVAEYLELHETLNKYGITLKENSRILVIKTQEDIDLFNKHKDKLPKDDKGGHRSVRLDGNLLSKPDTEIFDFPEDMQPFIFIDFAEFNDESAEYAEDEERFNPDVIFEGIPIIKNGTVQIDLSEYGEPIDYYTVVIKDYGLVKVIPEGGNRAEREYAKNGELALFKQFSSHRNLIAGLNKDGKFSSETLEQRINKSVLGSFTRIAEDRSLILLHKDANVTTPLHELAHLWETVLNSDEKQTILDWAGSTEWTRAVSEKWAKGFEQYVYEGVKTGDPEIDSLFAKFATWFKSVIKYFNTYFRGSELTPEIKGLYNSMLTGGQKLTEKISPLQERQLNSLFDSIGSTMELSTTPAAPVLDVPQNRKLSESDVVIFGHPGIGKTHLYEKDGSIIDFDSRYKPLIDNFINKKVGPENRKAYKKENPEEYQDFMKRLWAKAKKDAVAENKKLFASDMVLLRSFPEDFDKVITMSLETFVDRSIKREDFHPEHTIFWKNDLDKLIAEKVPTNKLIETDKYLSDLLKEQVPIEPKLVVPNMPQVHLGRSAIEDAKAFIGAMKTLIKADAGEGSVRNIIANMNPDNPIQAVIAYVLSDDSVGGGATEAKEEIGRGRRRQRTRTSRQMQFLSDIIPYAEVLRVLKTRLQSSDIYQVMRGIDLLENVLELKDANTGITKSDVSQVVDGNGEPKLVYHGTAVDFTEFLPGTKHGIESGSYFTDKYDYAKEYANKGEYIKNTEGKVIPAYLNIRNIKLSETPLIYHVSAEEFQNNAADGLKGVDLNSEKTSGNVYVVRNPGQVKSAVGNKGTFNRETDNIYNYQESKGHWTGHTIKSFNKSLNTFLDKFEGKFDFHVFGSAAFANGNKLNRVPNDVDMYITEPIDKLYSGFKIDKEAPKWLQAVKRVYPKANIIGGYNPKTGDMEAFDTTLHIPELNLYIEPHFKKEIPAGIIEDVSNKKYKKYKEGGEEFDEAAAMEEVWRTPEADQFVAKYMDEGATLRSMLRKMAVEGETSFTRELASKLVNLQSNWPTVTVSTDPHYYRGADNIINIDTSDNMSVSELEMVLLHEALHSYSAPLLYNSTYSTEGDQFKEFFKRARPKIEEALEASELTDQEKAKVKYALSNPDEFMAGIFTTPELMGVMKTLEPIRKNKQFTNLWEDLVNFLSSFFKQASGLDASLLEDAMDIGLAVLNTSKSLGKEGENLVKRASKRLPRRHTGSIETNTELNQKLGFYSPKIETALNGVEDRLCTGTCHTMTNRLLATGQPAGTISVKFKDKSTGILINKDVAVTESDGKRFLVDEPIPMLREGHAQADLEVQARNWNQTKFVPKLDVFNKLSHGLGLTIEEFLSTEPRMTKFGEIEPVIDDIETTVENDPFLGTKRMSTAKLKSDPDTTIKWQEGAMEDTLEYDTGDGFESAITEEAYAPAIVANEAMAISGHFDIDESAAGAIQEEAALTNLHSPDNESAADIDPSRVEDMSKYSGEDYTEEQVAIINGINETQKLIKGKVDIKNEDLPPALKELEDYSDKGALERYALIGGNWIWGRVTDLQTKLFRRSVGEESAKRQETSKRSEVARDTGTLLHEVNESILKSLVDSDGKKVPPKPGFLNKKSYEALVDSMRTLYNQVNEIQEKINKQNGYKKKPVFLLEKTLLDAEYKIGKDKEGNVLKGLAGTTDVLVVFSNGMGGIYDHKFINFPMKKNKDGTMSYIKKGLNDKKEQSYEMQISEYKRMLTQVYGMKGFIQTRILPVNVQYKYETKKTRAGKNYRRITDSIQSLVTADDVVKQLPVSQELTDDEDLNVLLLRLYDVRDDLRERMKKKRGDEVLRARLEAVKEAIQAIQISRDVSHVIELSNEFSSDMLDRLRKGTIVDGMPDDVYVTDEELVSAKETLTVFDNLIDAAANTIERMDKEAPDEAKKLRDLLAQQTGNTAFLKKAVRDEMYSRVKDHAQQYGIPESSLEDPQRPMGLAEKWYRQLSDFTHPIFRTFRKMVDRMVNNTRRELDDMVDNLETLTKNLEEWANSQGKSGVDIFDFLVNPATGNLYAKYSKEYWEEFNKAQSEKDITWAKANLGRTPEQDAKFEEKRKKKLADIEKAFSNKPKTFRIQMYNEWLYQNDITFNKGDNTAWWNKYALKAPKDEGKWVSEEYNRIMSNKPLKEYYEYYVEFNKKANEILDDVYIAPTSFVPNIQKGIIDSMAESGLSGMWKLKDLGKNIANSLEVREGDSYFGSVDPNTGQKKHEVPVLYVDPIKNKEGKEDISQKSKDLSRSMVLFAKSLYTYKYAKEMESMTSMMKDAVANQKTLVMGGGILAKPQRHPSTGELITEKGGAAALESSDILGKFVDYYVYGRRIQHADKTFEWGEKTYSTTKLVSAAIGFFSKKSLAFNFISAAGSTVAGVANTYMTGAKEFHYKSKDIAQTHMYEATRNPKHIAASHFFQVSQEDLDFEKAGKLSASKLVRATTVDKMMVLQRGESDFMERTITSAMMHNYGIGPDGKIDRIERIKKGFPELKDVKSLWELSEIKDDKFVVMQPDGEKITSAQYDQFRNIVRAVVSEIRGSTSKEDISIYQTTILGKMIGHFRGWLPKMADERFKDPRYNYTLEQVELGRFKVFVGDILQRGFIPTLSRFSADVVTFGMYRYQTNEKASRHYYDLFIQANPQHSPGPPYSAVVGEKPITYEDYLEQRQAQLRAMAQELRMYFLMFGAFWAVGIDWDEKEEKNTWLQNKMIKLLNRARMEVGFFLNPQEAIALIKSPIALSGLLTDIQKLLTNTVEEGVDLSLGYDSDKGVFHKTRDETGIGHYSIKMIPGIKGMTQFADMFSDEESLLDYLVFDASTQVKR